MPCSVCGCGMGVCVGGAWHGVWVCGGVAWVCVALAHAAVKLCGNV